MIFIKYANEKAEEITIDKIDSKHLVVGHLTIEELKEHYDEFGLQEASIDACCNEVTYRSAVEVREDYSFTSLKIMDYEILNSDEIYDPDGNNDYMALFVKKNFVLLIDVFDQDESTLDSFRHAMQKYFEKDVTSEKVIYAFFMNLIKNDNKFLEQISDKINDFEELVIGNNSTPRFNTELFNFKRKLTSLHSYYNQILDIVEDFHENDNDIFDDDNLRYIASIETKVNRLDDDVEDMLSNLNHLQDVYSTNIDLQMNKTMKIFTAVATIFLPLTLITGWFGMNFKEMPILSYKYGYIGCIIFTILLVIALIITGTIKKWWKQ